MNKINFQDKDSKSEKIQNRTLSDQNINQIKATVNQVIDNCCITDDQAQTIANKQAEVLQKLNSIK